MNWGNTTMILRLHNTSARWIQGRVRWQNLATLCGCFVVGGLLCAEANPTAPQQAAPSAKPAPPTGTRTLHLEQAWPIRDAEQKDWAEDDNEATGYMVKRDRNDRDAHLNQSQLPVSFSPDGKLMAISGWKSTPSSQTKKAALVKIEPKIPELDHAPATPEEMRAFMKQRYKMITQKGGMYGPNGPIAVAAKEMSRRKSLYAQELIGVTRTDLVETASNQVRRTLTFKGALPAQLSPDSTLVAGVTSDIRFVYRRDNPFPTEDDRIDGMAAAMYGTSKASNPLQLSDPRKYTYGVIFRVQCYDTRSGAAGRSFLLGRQEVQAFRFSPDGRHLLVGVAPNYLSCWDVQTGSLKWVKPGVGRPYAFGFSPDNRTVAVGGDFGPVQLYDMATGRPGQRLIVKAASVVTSSQVVFLKDNKTLATLAQSSALWDISSATIVSQFRTRGGGALIGLYHRDDAAEFSPDGTLLAQLQGYPRGSAPRDLELFDVRSSELKRKTPKPGGYPNGLSFSPDGSLLAVTQRGANSPAYELNLTAPVTVLLYDVQSATLLATFKLEEFRGLTAFPQFSPDNKRLAICGDQDTTVKILRID